jgi:hypothetical protein
MKDLLAQGLIFNPNVTTAPGQPAPSVYIQGPLQNINSLGDFLTLLTNQILFPISGVIVFLILIWGGYDLLMSQGESEKIESGRNKITAAIIGLVLLVLSYFFANLIGYIFGVGGGMF